MKRVGVLALQGAFELHRFHVESAGAEYIEVSTPTHFTEIDALILPGGESGVMLKLIGSTGLLPALTVFLKSDKPVWGMCAGAILMAKTVRGPEQQSFGVLDIDIERNAYGRQVDSFHSKINGYEVSYIRAPRITRVGSGLKISATDDSGAPVWVASGNKMVTTFHPETNRERVSPWHLAFIEQL